MRTPFTLPNIITRESRGFGSPTQPASVRSSHFAAPLPHNCQEPRLSFAWLEKLRWEAGCPRESSAVRLMTATNHSVFWAKLCLCVASWIAASTIFGSFDANAFVCLPSAEAVKQRDPTSWPSWTLRAPGLEGKKCWYASTRAAAHDHQELPAHKPTIVISELHEPEPNVTGSATEFEQARTFAPNLASTFEDRFLAVCPIAEHSVPGCGSQPK